MPLEENYPIQGTITDIDGNPAVGCVVQIINLVRGERITTQTNSNGEYIIDLANTSEGHSTAEPILIRAYNEGRGGIYKFAQIKTEITGSSLTQDLTLITETSSHPKELRDYDQAEHHCTADAKKVILTDAEGIELDATNPLKVQLVDSSGNVIKSVQYEENRLGSECSGTNGALGRVLTLQNTSTSGNPKAVWVDDQIINPADYTMVHLSANSTLTFDNINIYDAQTMRVTYYV